MATLTVTDYGAVGDGTSDDTEAIQTALDSATDGDTVYLPAGEYLVGRNGGSGPILTVPHGVSDLTIVGDPGYDETRVFMSQAEYDTSGIFPIIRTRLDSGVVRGLEIRNLTLDGNRPTENETTRTQGLQFYPSGTGGGHDILVEDCWVENFQSTAILSREGGLTFNRVTCVDNFQNFGLSERDDSTAGTSEYGLVVQNSVSKNADDVGIDHNQGGRLKVDGLYSENNGTGGLKSTKDNRQTRIQNATFQSEKTVGFRSNISATEDLPNPPLVFSLDTVAIRNVDRGGIYLSGDDASIQNSAAVGGPVEIRNCGGDVGGSEGGVTVHSAGGGSLDELRVIGTGEGPGVWFSADHELTIDTYYHANNQGGAVGTWSPGGDLVINSQRNEDPGRLDTPSEADVGAWTGSDSPTADPEQPGATLATAGGVAVSVGGALQTSLETTDTGSPSSVTLIDGFEEYPAGDTLDTTVPWEGAGSWGTSVAVTDASAATETQSAVLSNQYAYTAVQSTEGNGLPAYPGADCTIRVATYLEDGYHDLAFGIPAGETDFNANCYRIRGGPDYGGNPIIRRTVDGTSEPLATLGSDFPADTWLEHVIEFEATGSEVVLTYHGYAWDDTSGEWRQFESGTSGVDGASTFADDVGVGLATYRADNGSIWFDELRYGGLGDVGTPAWTPTS